MDTRILRILDANANRAREALRVLEDYARFAANDESLTAQLKEYRHDLAAALSLLPMDQAMLMRDTPGDVGTMVKTPAEMARGSMRDILLAAGKRLSESLRSLEECAKTIASAAAARLEQLRYRGYALEQALAQIAWTAGASEHWRSVRLCVLLTDSLCNPELGGWVRMLDAILAGAGDRASSLCVQLREKTLSDAELLRRARMVAAKCSKAGALAIVNDRPDVAVLSGVHGVHVGQTDLPCAEVRKLVGPHMIVGVSTENLEQAQAAVRAGASYVAVGPMFPTKTKHKPRVAGPAYAREAVDAISCPLVAIGGITPKNVAELTAIGISTVAVSSAILDSTDPGAVVRHFLKILSGKVRS